MRSYSPISVHVRVDGRLRFVRRLSAIREIRVPLGAEGWHLVAFDTPSLPKVGRRKEGARLIAYALG
jgi:hypothetical protein